MVTIFGPGHLSEEFVTKPDMKLVNPDPDNKRYGKTTFTSAENSLGFTVEPRKSGPVLIISGAEGRVKKVKDVLEQAEIVSQTENGSVVVHGIQDLPAAFDSLALKQQSAIKDFKRFHTGSMAIETDAHICAKVASCTFHAVVNRLAESEPGYVSPGFLKEITAPFMGTFSRLDYAAANAVKVLAQSCKTTYKPMGR